MKPFIAEFFLDSDLRVPDDSDSVVWEDDDFHLEIWSLSKDFSYVDKCLKAHLRFEAVDLNDAKEKCQDILALALNTLSLVMMASIRQAELTRVVDWTPGLVMRDCIYFKSSPRIATTLPLLHQDLINTAQALSKGFSDERMQSALRWFRLGLNKNNAEDQFISLWLALERSAEIMKGEEKVTQTCQVCKSDFSCSKCGNTPTHRKYAAEAIRDLILSCFEDEDEGRKAFKTLTKIRHSLMHGRRMANALKDGDFDERDVTNILAQIARNAIFMILRKEEMPDNFTGSILEGEDIVRGNLIVSGYIQTVFGPPNSPSLDANNGIQVSIIHPGQPGE